MENDKRTELLSRADLLTDIEDDLVSAAEDAKKPARIGKYLAIAASALVIAGAALLAVKIAKPKAPIGQNADNGHCFGGRTAEATSTPSPEATGRTDDYYKGLHPQWITVPETTPEPAAPPFETEAPQRFYSIEELGEAIKAGTHRSPKDPLKGLDHIYMPETLPQGAVLDYIEITSSHVVMLYDLDPEYCLFSYGRNNSVTAVQYAEDTHSEYQEVNGVYIMDSWQYSTACWDQEGCVFFITVPDHYDNEYTASLCRAVRVELPEPAKEEPLLTFLSEKAFFEAIRGEVSEESVLYGIEGYHALAEPPEELLICGIAVTKERVDLRYGEGDTGYILFDLLRGALPGDIEAIAQSCEYGVDTRRVGDITVVRQELGNGGGISLFWACGEECFRLFWQGEHEGLTDEEIISLCRVGFVDEPSEILPESTPLPTPAVTPKQTMLPSESEDPEETETGDVDTHSPDVGFNADGIMWIKDHGYGIVPLTAFAYGATYYKPEDGGEGRMIYTQGLDFIESIPEEQRGYDKIMKYFPQSYWSFETELGDGARIVRIDAYDPVTLEPLELDIDMDRLRDIGSGNVDEELNDRVFGHCHGSVLVDIIVEHEGSFVAELNEYETEAYHCGFVIDCGY